MHGAKRIAHVNEPNQEVIIVSTSGKATKFIFSRLALGAVHHALCALRNSISIQNRGFTA